MEIRCGSNYFRLGQRIGTGACGDIYTAFNSSTGREVAIKFESSRRGLHVTYESMVYHLLEDGVGFPKMHWHGAVGDMNVLVLDRLGPSFEVLVGRARASGRKALALSRVVAAGQQVLDRLEFLHGKGYVHRDIKPDNILLGGDDPSTVHLIDFGFARRFRDAKSGAHIANKETARPVGSVAFSSAGAHRGGEQSRRDDLEALGHVLVFLLRGKLPWYKPGRGDGSPSLAELAAKKQQTSVEALCRQCPEEFKVYVQYCRALRFEEDPDYGFLRRLLGAAAAAAPASPGAALVPGVAADWWLGGAAEPGRLALAEDTSDPSMSPEPSLSTEPSRSPTAAAAAPAAVGKKAEATGPGGRGPAAARVPEGVLPSLLGRWLGLGAGGGRKGAEAQAQARGASSRAPASGSADGNPELTPQDAIVDNPEMSLAADNPEQEFSVDNPSVELPHMTLLTL